ncbi:MAG TPA: HipA domain-containing protein [Solirubrobacteraceae bacterium]|jgi:serine/threonine-protein kinase HipA|nr:HipA domain-containing protein [Solirubrobacteraceae bacterium]
MVDGSVEVVVQLAGEDVAAGRMWTHRRRGAQSATFTYFDNYLQSPDAYALDPALQLYSGQQQTPEGRALFGAFSDAAPDGWGRRLLRRSELTDAREQGRTEREVAEVDYLLGVRDDLRQGALRFRHDEQGGFLAHEREGIPHLIDLPRLLNAAEQLERDEVSAEDLRLLLEGGSSLGGARPKAHVLDREGRLGIAKFPAPQGDDWDVIAWEAVALSLARDAGIAVPEFELHPVAGRPVLILTRFDRSKLGRSGYVSAMTLLEARDGEGSSYIEIAEAIEEHSPRAGDDLAELWRRIVFGILISNTDDHLRNHGFLRTSTAGWSLSPAFDLNPNPRRREFSTSISGGDGRNSIAGALDVTAVFRLTPERALSVLDEVTAATSHWRETAKRHGISASSIEQLAPAFEHGEAHAARGNA